MLLSGTGTSATAPPPGGEGEAHMSDEGGNLILDEDGNELIDE
jgi:hypothetical protein